jgi:threonylcarbamoyladenosine tRNA methylthiotransferase MtaB
MDFSDDLLRLMADSPRIAQHVHAPLQSGSDTVLRRMHRKYRPRHYADRIEKARAWMPQCAVGADVMTGFPGETDREFEQSYAFIDSLPFTYLHVFTYSERPGTPAATASGSVPVHARRERTRALRDLAAKKNLEFRRSLVGGRLSVVTLDQTGSNHNGVSAAAMEEPGQSQTSLRALSGNYVKVTLARPRAANRMEDVQIGGLTSDGVSEAGTLTVMQ